MNLFLPMSQFSDITETVTVSRPRTDWSAVVRRATQINPGKSETGFLASSTVPHAKAIWFIPMNQSIELRRGDRITDRLQREWIVVEPIPYDRFNTWRCRCVYETLAPTDRDYADLFRADSVYGDTARTNMICAASSIIAIPYSQTQVSERESGSLLKTVSEKIVFLTRSALDLPNADFLKRIGENEFYEIVSMESPPIYSDWGKITVRRYSGNQENWKYPSGDA